MRHVRTRGRHLRETAGHQVVLAASFDMLRLRKLPTCIQVDGPLLQRPHVLKPETLLLSLVVLPMVANRTALVSPSQERFLDFL